MCPRSRRRCGKGWQSPNAAETIRDILVEVAPDRHFCQHLYQLLERYVQAAAVVENVNVLPVLTCVAAGGESTQAEPLCVAWQLVRLAAKLLDDIQDQQMTSDQGLAMNSAMALMFAAQLTLGRLSISHPTESICQLHQKLLRSMLRASSGQHADLCIRLSDHTNIDPDRWFEIAASKSGDLLAWAAWAGAVAGRADASALHGYYAYGLHLGVLLQIADDFNGVWHSIGPSDLAQGVLNLSICYARHVAHRSERARLDKLLWQVRRAGMCAEMEVRDFLVELGAQAFMHVAAEEEKVRAMIALKDAHCVPDGERRLVELLNRVFPVAIAAELE